MIPPDARRQADLDEIRQTYEGYRSSGRARLWDPSNPGFARMMRDRDAALVELIRGSLPAIGGNVLDLGCGDGGLLGVAEAAGLRPASWTGLDLDPVSVGKAANQYPSGTFVEASADAVPVDADSMDVVVASTLFSSLPSGGLDQRVATEVARLLRPGGWLVWYDLRYDNPRNSAVHRLTAADLSRLFPGWAIEVRSMTLLPPLARRLRGPVPMAYGLLESIPLLRSHLAGRLQRPRDTR